MQYDKIEIEKFSDVVRLVEDGVNLFKKAEGKRSYYPITNLTRIEHEWLKGNLFRQSILRWFDRLDGSFEKGILCRVGNGYGVTEKTIRLIIDFDEISTFKFIDNSITDDGRWEYAKPLTKTELMAFVERAPDDVV